VVICDRFTDSTIAYQGAGNGADAKLIAQLADVAHAGLKPSRTLVFDCPYEVAAARLAKSGRKLDRFETQDRAFFERVRGAYLALAKAEPGRVRVIDASRDAAAVRDQVKAALWGF
jgi:dTMP kinase